MYGRRIHIALFGLLLGLGAVAPARAAAAVDVTSAGTISGSAVVGSELTVSAGSWSGPTGTTLGRQWLRCDSSTTTDCAWIDGATATSYTLVTADKGKWIRLALYAVHGNEWDYAISDATDAIAAAVTPTPTPTRTSTPTPTPAISPTPPPTATPAQDFDSADPPPPGGQPSGEAVATPVAQPSPAATLEAQKKTAAKKKAKPKMIKPYPTVRIRGRVTEGGADVALLTVRAPKGGRVTVTCKGSSCPVRELARATSLVHIRRFERELRAGTRLTIAVSKPNHITKVTTITIRKGKGPARADKCRMPGETKLFACPRG